MRIWLITHFFKIKSKSLLPLGFELITCYLNDISATISTLSTNQLIDFGINIEFFICEKNHVSKGNNFQSDVNCQRKSQWGALNCHGLTRKYLSQFRGISEIVKEFMEYIAESQLLSHNAKFNM